MVGRSPMAGGRALLAAGWIGGVAACSPPEGATGTAATHNATEPPTASVALAPPADEPLARPESGDRVLALELLAKVQRLEAYGATEEALRASEKALEADPSCIEARLLRAKLFIGDGDLHDPFAGLREARLAALVQPDDPAVIATEGLARFVLCDSARAQPLLERYCALPIDPAKQPFRAAALEALGFMAMWRRALDDASRLMDESHRLRPNRAYTCYGLAMIAGEHGDTAAKGRWLDDAVRLDPQLLIARHERFTWLERSHRTEDAAREKQLFELLRQLQDNTSKQFANDHAGKARLFGELAALLPDDPRSRVSRWRELGKLQQWSLVADEGAAALAGGLLAPEVVIETARAQARIGRMEAARASAALLTRTTPPAPPELVNALSAEIERLGKRVAPAAGSSK